MSAAIPAEGARRAGRPAPAPLVPFLAGNDVRLLLTSATILFVELLLIRWIPANVRYVGFFSNFLLIASFLGIGLGILLGRNGRYVSLTVFAVLLLLVVGVVIWAQLDLLVLSSDEIFFGLTDESRQAADTNFFVLPLVVVLVAAVMTTLALPLGPLLRSMPPLRAYAIDIGGSMIGIAGFTVLSAAGTPPLVWFFVTIALVVLLALGTRVTAWSAVGATALLAVAFAVNVQHLAGAEIWSPYYRINTYADQQGKIHINVNGIPHQALHPVSGAKEPFYEQVYKWFPGRTYERVLIVGAGSGSDVALALARGAQHVDAVEIDPRIQQFGADNHPDRPYQDPRVRRIVNDGRAFLRTTDENYDLVIYALPDSLTLVSTAANIRLESFLFTEESFAAVRDHLDTDGVFVLYNYYREDWLIAKLSNMLADAFGHQPLVRTYPPVQAAMAAGPLVAQLSGGPPPGDAVDVIPDVGQPTPKPATDDWPFLYLRTPFVADYYLLALGVILVGAFAAVAIGARATGTSMRRFSPHFFVLGVAFLLLETRSIVSFSLLFGTTWLVNALAFFAILASVLLAIFVNARWPIRKPTFLYAGLFISLAIAFILPPESLLIDPPALRYTLAAALAFAPVFFANLVFSYSFRDTKTADMAFASNLLGAMVGGALEYVALITGYSALLLVVALLYALAYLFATRFRFLADVDLSLEHDDQGLPPVPSPQPAPPLHCLVLDGVYQHPRGPAGVPYRARPDRGRVPELTCSHHQAPHEVLDAQGLPHRRTGHELSRRQRSGSRARAPTGGGLHLPHCVRGSGGPESAELANPPDRAATDPRGLRQRARLQPPCRGVLRRRSAQEAGAAVPLHHPPRHRQRTTDTQPCRRCRAAAQEPLPRRDHPHRDVTPGAHAAPGRACPPSKAASHPLPWRPRAPCQAASRDHSILRAPSRPHPCAWHPCAWHSWAWLPERAGQHQYPLSRPRRGAPCRGAGAPELGPVLKRVFEFDIEQCPQCGGTLKLIAAIEDPPVIAKILTHLGLSARAPPRSPARPFDRFQMAF